VVYETDTVYRDTTITVTQEIPGPTIYIEKPVVLYDTIYVDSSGAEVPSEAASLDTIFTDGAELEVTYFLTPRVYDIQYDPAPATIKEVTVTNTEYVTVKPPWWDRFKVGAGVGALSTAILVSLLK
jgi:hypothetical protein